MEDEERHQLLDTLVAMPMAAHQLFFEIYSRKATDEELNAVAGALGALVTLYEVSADGQDVRALDEQEVKGSRFTEGGGKLTFNGGRKPVYRIAVTQASLAAAIKTLKG